MTVQEFYTAIGGNYNEAKSRLMTDALILKFVSKFPADPNFALLEKALAADDPDAAFSASHTLKGVCLNLAFARLASAAVTLTDALREQNRASWQKETGTSLFAQVKTEYEAVLKEIGSLGV